MNFLGLGRKGGESALPHFKLQQHDSRYIAAIDPSAATGFAPPRLVTFEGGASDIVSKVKEALLETPDPDLEAIQKSYGAKPEETITLFDLAGLGNISVRDNTLIVGLRITTPGCHQIVVLSEAISRKLKPHFPTLDVLATTDFLAFKSQLALKDSHGNESVSPAFKIEEIRTAHDKIIRTKGLEGYKVFMDTVRSIVKNPELFIPQVVSENVSSPTQLALDLVTYFEFHAGLSPHTGDKFKRGSDGIKRVGSQSPFAAYITEYPEKIRTFNRQYKGDLSPKQRELAIVQGASETDKGRLKSIISNAVAI